MTIEQAIANTGGLSKPSKMPCHGFSIPANRCKTGSKLRKLKNTTCSKCYALKGFYNYPNAKSALELRFELINHPDWVESMAFLINNFEYSGYFRWFDSGDLQSVAMLRNICEVCRLTPHIRHWLPTREYTIVKQYLKKFKLPSNLIIRLSAYIIDGQPPTLLAGQLKVNTSSVVTFDESCPSKKQNNKCLLCRKCWDFNVNDVSYKLH